MADSVDYRTTRLPLIRIAVPPRPAPGAARSTGTPAATRSLRALGGHDDPW